MKRLDIVFTRLKKNIYTKNANLIKKSS